MLCCIHRELSFFLENAQFKLYAGGRELGYTIWKNWHKMDATSIQNGTRFSERERENHNKTERDEWCRENGAMKNK